MARPIVWSWTLLRKKIVDLGNSKCLLPILDWNSYKSSDSDFLKYNLKKKEFLEWTAIFDKFYACQYYDLLSLKNDWKLSKFLSLTCLHLIFASQVFSLDQYKIIFRVDIEISYIRKNLSAQFFQSGTGKLEKFEILNCPKNNTLKWILVNEKLK